jgi:hypothetical protein
MGFEREGAVCEYIEIMQIPPRFERRCAAYKCVAPDLQYLRRAPASEREPQRFCNAVPGFTSKVERRNSLICTSGCVGLRPSRQQDGSKRENVHG